MDENSSDTFPKSKPKKTQNALRIETKKDVFK